MYSSDDFKASVYISTDDNVRQLWQQLKGKLMYQDTVPDVDGLMSYIEALSKQVTTIDEDVTLYRARINESPYKRLSNEELNAPPPEAAKIGRLNPKGVSFLYTSSAKELVVKEVRAYMHAKIDIAECRPTKELKIIDLTMNDQVHEKEGHNFRKVFSDQLSKPAIPNNNEIDYLPTQWLALYFKRKGFDGIKFRSSYDMNNNQKYDYNICFFDPSAFDISYIETVRVNRIQIDFSKEDEVK